MANKRRRKKRKNYSSYIILAALIVLIIGLICVVVNMLGDNKKDNGKETTGKVQQESTNKIDDKNSTVNESTQPTTPAVTKDRVHFENFTIPDSIIELDTEIISLGYSQKDCDRDEYNRPKVIENIEEKYGKKYNAIYIGEENSKKIYLTFTMGYENYNDGVPNTDVVMDILKEKNVPAIFFVDGGYVRNYADMCKKIVDNGFVVGCHGWDHPAEGVATYSLDKQLEDAKKIYEAIYAATGVEPYYYRFGSGIWNERALALLSELGFRNVFYSFTYFDYDINNQPDVADSLQSMIDNIHDGEIIYLHTVSNTSVAILSDFIDAARAKGYEFELVP